MAAARIGIGAGAVHYYLSNYAHRSFLFGPNAYIVGDTWPDIYGHIANPAMFELLFHAGILAALAFAIFGGRVLAVAHAFFFWSLHARNPALFDGGDAFGRIAAVVMILAVTNAYLAPGARRRREALSSTGWGPLLHNSAVVMLVIQLGVIYLSAGMFKATDGLWQSGGALHRIAQLEDYRFVDWASFVSNPIVGRVLGYGTIALELAFPIALFTRSRRPVILGLIAMHLALAGLMGLVGFALHMCAGLALCLFDPDEEGIARLSASVHLDLETEPLSDPLPELVRVPLVDIGAVHERDE
jgi:hypothetical protein